MSAERGDVALGHEATGTSSPVAGQAALPRVAKCGAALLVAAALAVIVAARFGATINNDVAWYIYSAGAFLDGGRLYDAIFFEVNPPLMLYLTVPGVLLARLTGLFEVHGYVLSVFVIVTFSLLLGTRVLSDAPARDRHAYLVFSFLVLVILPGSDFGQRSHLMVCLALPYLLLIAGRQLEGPSILGWHVAAGVGAVAGVGFAIKPHYLLLMAALEGMLVWRTRRLLCVVRPETLAVGVVVAFYAGAVLVFTPEYLTRIVPYALAVYNSGYHNPLGFVLARPETLLVPLAALAHWRVRRSLAPRQAAMGDVLVLSALTMFAVYLMQMKGWNYHIYPTTAMLVMLAGTIVTAPKAAFRPVRALVLAATVALLAKAAFLAEIQRYPLMHRLMPYVRAHAADGAIYFFSCNVWTGFPMTVYAGVEWASRFPALWLLPGLEQRRHAGAAGSDAELLAEMHRFTTEAVVADLSVALPELIFVDARPEKRWCGDMGLDFIAHFLSDPRFARLWSEYELIDDVEGFEVYGRRPLRPFHP